MAFSSTRNLKRAFICTAVACVVLVILATYMYMGPIAVRLLGADLWKTQSKVSVSVESRVSEPLRIPKILHQVFRSSQLYKEYESYVNSCLALNPDWQYYLWRDEDSLQLIEDHYPQFLNKYKSYKDLLQRSDSIRYIVLHHYGGVYLDMDVFCLQPFFPALNNVTAFLDQEGIEHAALLYGLERNVMNSAMGAMRGHPFFMVMLQAMLGANSASLALDSTGPFLLGRVYEDWLRKNLSESHPMALLPSYVFSPRLDTVWHNFKAICPDVIKSNLCGLLISDK